MKRLLILLMIAAGLTCGDDDADENARESVSIALLAAGVFNNFCGQPVFYEPGTYSVQINQGEFYWFDFPGEVGNFYRIDVTEASGQNVAAIPMTCVSGGVSRLINSTSTGQVENFRILKSDRATTFFYCTEGCDNAFQFTIPATNI